MLKINRIIARFTVCLVSALVTAGCSGGGSSSSSSPTTVSSPVSWYVPDGSTLSATQMATLFDSGQLYFNVPSTANSTGEIRGEITPSPAVFQTDAGNPFAPNPANHPLTFATILGGDQVKPRNVITTASGYGSVTLDPVTKQLTGVIVTSGVSGVAATINDGLPGSSGTIVLTLEGGPVVWTVPSNTVLSDAQITRLSAGAYYFNVQSNAFPNGELRGQLNQQVRFASLKGSNEVVPVATSASGIAVIALTPPLNPPLSLSTRQFYGFVKVGGLSSAVTSVTIHFGPAGTDGPGIVDLENRGNGVWAVPAINNPVLTPAVIAAFNNDTLYVNVFTQNTPAGELRGQLLKSSGRIGTAVLSGAKETPPVATQATGTGMLAWNSVTGLVNGSLVTDKMTATTANIHSGPAATNGPVLFAVTTASPVTVAPIPGVSFALDIQPIFNANCAVAGCHVPGGIAPMSLQAGVSYDIAILRVVPGDAAASYLYQRITTNSFPSFPQMPLNRDPLPITELNLFKNWINSGALNN
jgi:hypothetical protein